MKRLTKKGLLLGSGLMCWALATVLVASTLAWFSTSFTAVDEEILGSTKGAYFAGGDGSDDDPYQIASPVHLYNLAWLQDIGYFNKDSNDVYPYNQEGTAYNESSVTTSYFVLNNDIDMTGWKIPPIGTKKYPFIGQFDGNDHTISNLVTTNDEAQILAESNPHPNGMLAADINKNTDVNIVGLFGVVGSAPTNQYAYTYSSITPSIKDFGLKDSTIESATAGATLIGLAAGYVNGTISGVGVNDSIIKTGSNASATSYTSNLSDHSLVGYEASGTNLGQLNQTSIQQDVPSVSQDVTNGAGDQWGGSIGMNDIYNNIRSVLNNQAVDQTYESDRSKHYDENGEFIDDVKAADSRAYINYGNNSSGWSNTTTSEGAYGYFRNAATSDSSGNQTASYSIMKRDDTDDYLYLYGEKTHTLNGAKTITSYQPADADVITDGSGHYLTINQSGSIANASLNDALGWVMDQSGHILTHFNNRAYYLTNNNGTLTVSPSSSALWTYDIGNNVIYNRVDNGDLTTYYCLRYNNGWGLQNNQAKYTFYSGGYYINATTSGVTASSNATTIWHVYMNNSDAYPYFTSGNTNYYLAYNDNNLGVTTNRSDAFYISGGTLRHDTGALFWVTRHYINLLGTNLSISTTSQSYTINRSFDPLLWSSSTSISGSSKTIYSPTSSTTESSSFTTNATYLPLGWDENTPTDIANKNTGYIVSGANYASQPGDIRVSKYGNGNLRNSYGSSYTSNITFNDTYDSRLEIITRTSTSNGFVRISDTHNANNSTVASDMSQIQTKLSIEQLGFQKYATSRNALYNRNLQTNKGILAQDNYVYGLHFMDAEISKDRKISVPYAKIDNTTYSNYELPEDCIDFNLRKSGIINFFAGTYFPGNTTFFSLHQIFRDSQSKAIEDIKEISLIYPNVDAATKKRTPYVYQYQGGSYSSIGTPGETPIFDMSWVTSPEMVQYAMYYFEIPVNGGEYALGSVHQKDGAYLIYLDIGASKYNVNTQVIEEKKTTTTVNTSYPLGVDFTSSSTYSSISGGNSASIVIPASAKGETLSYSLSGSTLSVTGDTSSTITASHLAPSFSATDGSSSLSTSGVTTTRVVEEKTTTSTYNESGITDNANYMTIVDTVTTTYVNNVQTGRVEDEGIPVYSEILEYSSTITMAGLSSSLVSIHYHAYSSVNVSLSFAYIPAEEDHELNGTYALSITSDQDIVIYVDNVLEEITYGGEDETPYLHKFAATINGATVHTGDTITIRAT